MMKKTIKIVFTAALALSSLGMAKQTQAAAKTIHVSDYTYWVNSNIDQVKYNNTDNPKNGTYNYLGKEVFLKSKIKYRNGKKQKYVYSPKIVFIKGHNYYILKAGGYVKDSDTLKVTKQWLTVKKTAPLYDKKGNNIGTVIAPNTKYAIVQNKTKNYYYDSGYYFQIDKNVYIPAYAVSAIDEKPALYLKRNSNVYDFQGKKIKKLNKGYAVKSYNKLKTSQEPQRLYIYYKNAFAYIKDYKINGKRYFRIGKNQYIKADNVSSLADKDIIAKGPITVTLNKNTVAYQMNHDVSKETKIQYKKGQKIKVDYSTADVYLGESEEYFYYHILNTGNEYIYGGDIQRPAREVQNRSFSEIGYANLRAKQNSRIYDFNGNASTSQVLKGQYFEGDYLLYLYNPQTKKTNLYYHLVNSKNIQEFVPASALEYRYGKNLSARNTVKSAQKNAKVATSKQKKSLNSLIKTYNKMVKDKREYLYHYASNKKLFDTALSYAKAVNKNKTATVNEVTFARKYLKDVYTSLDGFEPFS